MLVSIAFDATDFFLGRIPIIGTFIDILGGLIGVMLWKSVGALQFLEVIDFSDQFDAMIPTLTIAGVLSIKEIWRD